jgi:hypothetical protein
MHATSTQSMADHRTVAKAALAAIIFTAGVALGAVVGTTVAPVAAPAPVMFEALDPDVTGFRLHRDGEIGVEGLTTNGLRDQRNGEINAGAGSAEKTVPAQLRSKIGGP